MFPLDTIFLQSENFFFNTSCAIFFAMNSLRFSFIEIEKFLKAIFEKYRTLVDRFFFFFFQHLKDVVLFPKVLRVYCWNCGLFWVSEIYQ